MSSSGALEVPKSDAMRTTKLPQGFDWVPIADVRESEFISEAEDWNKGIGKQEMRAGLERFRREMLPVIARHENTTREDFVQIDKDLSRITSTGIVHPESLAQLYDVIFGNDSIAVDASRKGELVIISGRHRLSVARELGWTHVPARVNKKD